MLKLQPIEFFLRAVPEGFLFIFAVYIFSKTNIIKKKYIVSSVLFAVIMFIVRLLPINYGVHTILGLMFLVILTSTYNKVDVIKSMRSALILVLIQFLTEGINILILNLIPNINIYTLVEDPIIKAIVGLPSLIMATLVVYIFYAVNKKKEG
jgi:hypothetical protein